MISWKPEQDSLQSAREADAADPLRKFRSSFVFPHSEGQPLYFAGHSLGLMPLRARDFVVEELDAWARYAVEGHLEGKHPWLPYHENVTESLAHLVGGLPSEVVAMNSLTVNLHLMMVSFYRPTKTRHKILIENNTFPSDKYAVDSQARYHGYDPKEAVIELKPRAGEMFVRTDEIEHQIEMAKDSLALVLIGNCNYLSGQRFDSERIAKVARKCGIPFGLNLAHGAGNLDVKLHDWEVDFAVWCSYKYLNAGPGAIAGAFVHQKHLGRRDFPRWEGWWGHNKEVRFKMGPNFDPIPTVEAWQLSNPPIFQLAALRASLELFDQATMPALRAKGDRLTGYLEWLLKKNLGSVLEIVTPAERGSMLCLRVKKDGRGLGKLLQDRGVALDFREPDILRMTPAPLYTSFEDVYRLVQVLQEVLT